MLQLLGLFSTPHLRNRLRVGSFIGIERVVQRRSSRRSPVPSAPRNVLQLLCSTQPPPFLRAPRRLDALLQLLCPRSLRRRCLRVSLFSRLRFFFFFGSELVAERGDVFLRLLKEVSLRGDGALLGIAILDPFRDSSLRRRELVLRSFSLSLSFLTRPAETFSFFSTFPAR